MIDCKLMIVTWLDSRQTEGSWEFLSEFEPRQPIMVQSVGWIIQNDEDAIVLAQSLARSCDDDLQSAGRKVIPKMCVVKVETLRETL